MVKPIHLLKADDLAAFDHTISESEVVIHQPIGSSFGEFGIDSVKKRLDQQQTSADLSSRSGCGSQPIPATSRRCSKPLR
jgi:hypothetical protein